MQVGRCAGGWEWQAKVEILQEGKGSAGGGGWQGDVVKGILP